MASSEGEVIETTVAKVGAELALRGLDPEDRVTIMTPKRRLGSKR